MVKKVLQSVWKVEYACGMSKLKSVFQEVRGNFLWDIIKWSILGVLTMVGLIGTAIVQRWRGIPYDVVGIVIVGVVWLLALVLAFVIGRLWKRKSQLPPAAEQVADNEPEAQPINETSHPTPCREKWLHDIADRQKQSINSWLRVFSVEIVQHDLLRKSPFIDFRMSISSYSVWPLSLVSVSGSLVYAARPLEGTLTLRENRITEMQLGNAKSFIVRCSFDPEEAIFILNMGGSFEFSEMRLRVTGTPNFEDVAPTDVVPSHAIQHQEIYK